MTRAPFQVLVFPYRFQTGNEVVYAVFRRSDEGEHWQAIAGGGEVGETLLEAAKREAWEEAGIDYGRAYLALDSFATVPADQFGDFRDREDLFVISEHAFGVEVTDAELRLSREHTAYAWLPYEDAVAILRWDSNRNALWELNRRLRLRLATRD